MWLGFHVFVDGEETLVGVIAEVLDSGSDVFMGALKSIFKVLGCGNYWFGRHRE